MFPCATLTSWGFSTASRVGDRCPSACQQVSRTSRPKSIVITYLNSNSKDLLLPADLLVAKAISDAFRCRS